MPIRRSWLVLRPFLYSQLGNLVSIDGSLIDAVLSMAWVDCRKVTLKQVISHGSRVTSTEATALSVSSTGRVLIPPAGGG